MPCSLPRFPFLNYSLLKFINVITTEVKLCLPAIAVSEATYKAGSEI